MLMSVLSVDYVPLRGGSANLAEGPEEAIRIRVSCRILLIVVSDVAQLSYIHSFPMIEA